MKQISLLGKIVLAVTVFLLLSGLFLIVRPKQPEGIKITVTTVPSNATVLVKNKKLKNGVNYLLPGKYDVTVSKEGFETEKFTATIDELSPNIQVALTAVSTEAKAWAKKNQALYTKFEGLVGKASSDAGKAFYAKNPITKLLPHDEFIYKIGYLENPDRTITLTIYADSPLLRSYALEKIRSWGYDPTNYKINFINFINPLEPS